MKQKVRLVRQKDGELKNLSISIQMYTLIRSISAGVSEIIRFECSNTLWIVKFINSRERVCCDDIQNRKQYIALELTIMLSQIVYNNEHPRKSLPMSISRIGQLAKYKRVTMFIWLLITVYNCYS